MSYWDLEETGGGGLNGATGIITQSYFKEGDYGWQLYLETTFDDPENYPKFEGGTFGRHFALGKGWSSADQGETAVHDSGEIKGFNASSKMRQLIKALAPLLRDTHLDFDPYTAKSFLGLHLEWENVPVSKRAPKVDENNVRVLGADGKEIWEDVPGATELLPVKLAGEAAAAETTPADVSGLGLTTDQINALTDLAETVASDPKPDARFTEGYIKIPGLLANKAFMDAVSSDSAGVRAAFTPFS